MLKSEAQKQENSLALNDVKDNKKNNALSTKEERSEKLQFVHMLIHEEKRKEKHSVSFVQVVYVRTVWKNVLKFFFILREDNIHSATFLSYCVCL